MDNYALGSEWNLLPPSFLPSLSPSLKLFLLGVLVILLFALIVITTSGYCDDKQLPCFQGTGMNGPSDDNSLE